MLSDARPPGQLMFGLPGRTVADATAGEEARVEAARSGAIALRRVPPAARPESTSNEWCEAAEERALVGLAGLPNIGMFAPPKASALSTPGRRSRERRRRQSEPSTKARRRSRPGVLNLLRTPARGLVDQTRGAGAASRRRE